MRVKHAWTAALLAGLTASCGPDQATPGASSPRALLDKLIGGLEDLQWDRVASCFDASSSEGHAVAQLAGAAVDVLKRLQMLETTLRERFGGSYATEHMVVPGAALLLERLRECVRLARPSVEGDTARLHVGAAEPLTMRARYGRWYLDCRAPFAGDAELAEQVSHILEIFGRHAARATDLLRSARSEAGYRAQLAALGKETQNACASFLLAVLEGFRRRGLILD